MRTRITIIGAAYGISLVYVETVSAVVIDSFDTSQSVVAFSGNPTDGHTALDAAVIGGERDIRTNWSSGPGSVTMTIGSGLLDLTLDASTEGNASLQWDGVDGTSLLNPTGLGGADLTDGGVLDRLAVHVDFDDLQATLVFTVYSPSGNGTGTIHLTGGVPAPVVFEIEFANFTGAVDFTNVGAIQLDISSATLGGNLQIGLIESAGPSSCQVQNMTQGTSHGTIQAAINAAANGDDLVAPSCTYNEIINFNGKAITLRSSDGSQVTIIDGAGLNDTVVRCVNGEGRDTVIEGFTITGGDKAGFGGGMLIQFASPTVTDCWFVENTAENGGGMSILSGNAGASRPNITNCRFIMNTATQEGGGMNNNGPDGQPTSDPIVANCTFDRNTAATNGGGMFNNNGASPEIVNCTFSGNEAGTAGGGMKNGFSSPGLVTVANCIVWDNSPDQIVSTPADGDTLVTYSDVQGGWPGEGNIDLDPLFVSFAFAPTTYRLAAGSPCIDAGDNTAFLAQAVALGGLGGDLDGKGRFVDDQTTVDTGNGIGAIIDMGAYEFRFGDSDLDGDGDTDGNDFLTFSNCFNGSLKPPKCP